MAKFISCIRNIAFFLPLLGLLQTAKCEEEEELIVKAPNITSDLEVVCEAISTPIEDIKVDIDGMMDYDDLLRFTVMYHKHDLGNPSKTVSFPAIEWKGKILFTLFKIFQRACPHGLFIDPNFVRSAVNLFMIYQNSDNTTQNRSDEWNPIEAILEKCASDGTFLLSVIGDGFYINELLRGNTGERVPILPPEELADVSKDMDLIIDTVWWLFSLAFSQCYWVAPNPGTWGAQFKQLFYQSFLANLGPRWLHAGPNIDFGVIFGDTPLETNIKNLRACVTGSYMKYEITDRQLVRPLTLAMSGQGIEAGLNKKTGKSIFDENSNAL